MSAASSYNKLKLLPVNLILQFLPGALNTDKQTFFKYALDEQIDFCCVLCHSSPEVTPRSPPVCEKRPEAQEEESEASETEDKQTPAAGQTDSTSGKKTKRRRNRKKKKKAATVE